MISAWLPLNIGTSASVNLVASISKRWDLFCLKIFRLRLRNYCRAASKMGVMYVALRNDIASAESPA